MRSGKQCAKGFRIEPDFASGYAMDGIDQLRGRAMLQENPASAHFHDAQGFGVGHPCRDHEDAAVKRGTAHSIEKHDRGVISEIIIQKYNVNRMLRQHVARISDGVDAIDYLYVRLGLKKPAQTLAEKSVIVDQQEADFVHHLRSRDSRSKKQVRGRPETRPLREQGGSEGHRETSA